MKNTLVFALIGISLFSVGCSTAYKSTQTVDDVYYSPGRPSEERVDVKKEEEKKQQYDQYISSADDRYLRMKVSNYSRWYSLDDYNYWNDSRYDFNAYNSYYNYHTGWNSYYYYNNLNYSLGKGNYYPGTGWTPTHTIVTYYGGKSANPGTTSGSSITAYRNKTYSNTNGDLFYNPKTGVTSSVESSSSSNFSNLVKRVFASSSATSNGGSYDRAVRSFNNSSSNSSSSTTYSSSSAPATTSSSAGGNSGGVSSSGSSASGGRATRN
jgi:hypothetical protein